MLLTLGDSYTVGEGIEPVFSWPHRVIKRLHDTCGVELALAQVAKTGWTSYELLHAIDTTTLPLNVSVVMLLVGVNNQYRGYPIETFSREYDILLARAEKIVGGEVERICAISIPDWSISPFAEQLERKKIASEIEAYNEVCALQASQRGAHFIDLLPLSRRCSTQNHFAEDQLHPSSLQYEEWTLVIEPVLRMILTTG